MNTPFDIKRMLEEMNNQLEETTQWWAGEQSQLGGRRLPVDIVDNPDEFIITAEMPGFDREDIDITVTDQTLWFAAHSTEDETDEKEQYYRKERRTSEMKRSIRLPSPVISEESEATLHNGVLTLTLPKAHASEESKQIEIEST